MAERATLPSGPASDWHARDADETVSALGGNRTSGLTPDEAARRLQTHGPNALPSMGRRSSWLRLALQFHNPLIYVLLAAGAMTLALQDFIDAAVICGVVVINALIGFVQEGKAEKALEAVQAMLASRARVLRGGELHEIDARNLVPGDIVLVESGDRVPADLRLIRSRNLRVNEGALTGESVPSDKTVARVDAATALADRHDMAYSGTTIAAGQAQGLVVATGRDTEIGRIGTLVGQVPNLSTPLTRRLDQFARQITLLILVVGVLTFLFGYFSRGMPMLEIFLAVVGLAVAAIPEGLPAIVTIVLAIGTRAMARKNAIVRRLPAVETLGSVTVICSDKTGTLTRNEMTAVAVMVPGTAYRVSGSGYAPEGGFQRDGVAVDAADEAALQAVATCALLCNDAQLQHDDRDGWRLVGDPTEGALLTLARKAGCDPVDALAGTPRIDAIPFESKHRFMATLHHDHAGHHFILVKGAPEQVLALCTHDASGAAIDAVHWERRIVAAASAGQRVLALARRELATPATELAMDDIAADFSLLGLVGLIDPPRDEAIVAVADCRSAGLRVKMITGDHAVTATAIGAQLGLATARVLTGDAVEKMGEVQLRNAVREIDVVARASPEHKLRLIAALQANGDLVAMTGDGVNDAPALKAADIGVAMGHKGTDAAREAADLVLTDDNFATIAAAVREGRVVFDNIKKSLLFILPTNGGEAGVILLAVFAGLALPVTAGQILWINMVTTITLALALAFEPAESGVMRRPPRSPTEALITPLLGLRIAIVSLLMVLVTFTVFEWELARGNSIETARTAAVNMLVVGELVYLFNVRHFTAAAFTRTLFTANPAATAMALILIALQLLFTYAPPMQQIFQTTPLDAASWSLIVGLGLAKFLAVEIEKWILRQRGVRSL